MIKKNVSIAMWGLKGSGKTRLVIAFASRICKLDSVLTKTKLSLRDPDTKRNFDFDMAIRSFNETINTKHVNFKTYRFFRSSKNKNNNDSKAQINAHATEFTILDIPGGHLVEKKEDDEEKQKEYALIMQTYRTVNYIIVALDLGEEDDEKDDKDDKDDRGDYREKKILYPINKIEWIEKKQKDFIDAFKSLTDLIVSRETPEFIIICLTKADLFIPFENNHRIEEISDEDFPQDLIKERLGKKTWAFKNQVHRIQNSKLNHKVFYCAASAYGYYDYFNENQQIIERKLNKKDKTIEEKDLEENNPEKNNAEKNNLEEPSDWKPEGSEWPFWAIFNTIKRERLSQMPQEIPGWAKDKLVQKRKELYQSYFLLDEET